MAGEMKCRFGACTRITKERPLEEEPPRIPVVATAQRAPVVWSVPKPTAEEIIQRVQKAGGVPTGPDLVDYAIATKRARYMNSVEQTEILRAELTTAPLRDAMEDIARMRRIPRYKEIWTG